MRLYIKSKGSFDLRAATLRGSSVPSSVDDDERTGGELSWRFPYLSVLGIPRDVAWEQLLADLLRTATPEEALAALWWR
eukprot:6944707-Pyramimonas_sp.AAC.2